MKCDHNLAIQTRRVDFCQYSGSTFGTSHHGLLRSILGPSNHV
jgi:hypothetical protein